MAKKNTISPLERYRERNKRSNEVENGNLTSSWIPTKIFSDRSVAVLEAITEYLKDTHGLNYHEIGVELGRDDRTIWTAYHRAKQKHNKLKPTVTETKYIPVKVLQSRDISIFEAVVLHLKEQGLKYSQIAKLTARNDRTIWTVCNRALKKRGENNA